MAIKGRIIVVEPEPSLAANLETELTCAGYQVSLSRDGESALASLTGTAPDLVLLDTILPDTSGLELCRHLRMQGFGSPVVLLTEGDSIADRVASLEAGADDYLVKPVQTQELLHRIYTYLHRRSGQSDHRLVFLDLTLDPVTREVTKGSQRIELTGKEFELLRYLMQHPRQVLTRQQILQHVWGYDFAGDSNIIEVYIRYLRLKLERPGEKRLLQTVRGVGYVLKD
ncbi:MAG: response regulator transcription factor [Thermostichales cyanobacterium SZTDM-1c_bins_54]